MSIRPRRGPDRPAAAVRPVHRDPRHRGQASAARGRDDAALRGRGAAVGVDRRSRIQAARCLRAQPVSFVSANRPHDARRRSVTGDGCPRGAGASALPTFVHATASRRPARARRSPRGSRRARSPARAGDPRGARAHLRLRRPLRDRRGVRSDRPGRASGSGSTPEALETAVTPQRRCGSGLTELPSGAN